MTGKLDDPVARAVAARAIAESTGGRIEPRDPLTPYEREMYLAWDSAQLRVPLRNRAEVKVHLEMIEEAVRGIREDLDKRPRTERSDLMHVQTTLRGLNRKLNAYRTTRRKG